MLLGDRLANGGIAVIHILLAEDNPTDVMLVGRALEEHEVDCQILVIGDGAEALRFFRDLDHERSSRAPDLVLVDLHLPKHGGEEIVRELRANEGFANTPVVVMSSSDSPVDRAMAKTYSASYFRKPADLDAFMELGLLVKRALG